MVDKDLSNTILIDNSRITIKFNEGKYKFLLLNKDNAILIRSWFGHD